MKKILAIAAVAALTAGVSAYAANPFSDVSTSDWAYQAVSELSEQGIVEGYPDGTFKGERNITRYELAQIIARLMANEDQYNAEQRAMIDQLASEYADELDTLGVRVGNLESKVGNISWSGSASMNWKQKYGTNNSVIDMWKGKMKIKAHAQVNDNTYVEGVLRGNMNFHDDKNSDVYMQKLYVHHDIGNNLGVNLGKYSQFFGQTGMFFDDEIKGVEATYVFNQLPIHLTVGYGRVNEWKAVVGEKDVTYAQLAGSGFMGHVDYDIEYIKGHSTAHPINIWGAGMTIGVTDKIDVFGDYYKNTKDEKRPVAWTAGIGFGHQDNMHVGSFRIGASYVNAELGAVLGGYTYDVSPLSYLTKDIAGVNKVKYWTVETDVTIAKNVRLHGEYAFNVKLDQDGQNDKNLGAVSSHYVF